VQELIDAAKEFPIYLTEVVIGLLIAIMTDPPITVLFIGACCGMVVFPSWAVWAVVAVVYVVCYVINNLGGAITKRGSGS
jgi:hypothetical protein